MTKTTVHFSGPQLPPSLMSKLTGATGDNNIQEEEKKIKPPTPKQEPTKMPEPKKPAAEPKAKTLPSLVGGYGSSEDDDDESFEEPKPKAAGIKSLVAYDDSCK